MDIMYGSEIKNKLSVLLLLLCVLPIGIVHAVVDSSQCSGNTSLGLHCTTRSVPVSIPRGIRLVVLKDIDLTTFRGGQFKHVSWANVVYLRIDSMDTLPAVNLPENSFSGLSRLQHLKIRGSGLTTISKYAFNGLPNLEKLDLSDNAFLWFGDVIKALNRSAALPALKWLALAKVQSFYAVPVALTTESLDVLFTRAIEYLDLSYVNISPLELGLRATEKMCMHLKHIVLFGAIVTHPSAPGNLQPCQSLKIVDGRNLHSRDLFEVIKHLYLLNWFKHFLTPIVPVETLLMSNVLKNYVLGKVNIENTVFDFSNVPLNLQKVYISRNNLQTFNITIFLHPTSQNSMTEADFSENVLEYISPKTFHHSINTERLNLSRNNLNTMYTNHHYDMEMLVNPLTKLKHLDLSHNGLTGIPYNMFFNNSNLQVLDLSGNSLTHIDFKIDHLIHLEILDLSKNRIQVLSKTSLMHFDNIWQVQRDQSSSLAMVDGSARNKPNIILNENPLECTCDDDHLGSIEWIQYSGFVRGEDANPVCLLDHVSIPIFHSALEKTKEHCHRLKVLRNALISGVSAGFVAIVGVIVAVVILKRRTKINAMQKFVTRIKNGDKLKFLIFLSFCNEDGDEVLEDIFPRMNEEASRALNCDRKLVSCGEMDFRPGISVCSEAMRCIEESAVVIFVMSNRFCEKSWCRMEMDTANAQRKPVILLMLEKVNDDVMTPYIRKLFNRYTRAKWVRDENGGHPHPAWPVLISSVIELGSSFNHDNPAKKEGRVYTFSEEDK